MTAPPPRIPAPQSAPEGGLTPESPNTPPPVGPPPHVVISGRGRSGSNFLLRLFDYCPHTFCRNEPNMLPGTRMHALPDLGRVVREYDHAFAERWDAVMAHTARSLSGIEDYPPVAKAWMVGRPLARPMIKLSRYTRVRRALGVIYPAFGRIEWPLPGWVVNQAELANACIVLKLNQAPGWTVWMLRHRPTHRIIHNVRHPGGFLNSWRNRWLKKSDADEVLRRNRERLRLVAEHDAAWAARFGDIDRLDVEWTEAWYWRYSNEVIWEAGQELEHYRLSVFEDVTADPQSAMRELFVFARLSWSPEVEAGVRANTRTSQQIAAKWRDALEPSQVEMVETVLDGSPMAAWWE